MKFGAVPERLLADMDLRLPPEPEWNQHVLPGARSATPRVYVGAAVWGSAAWCGMIYPEKTPATRFRQWYPQQFNAIELNATHYNIYAPEVIRQWAAPAKGRDFKFCPKFPQQISHNGAWDDSALTDAFFDSIGAFEELLGPAFLQLSEYAAPVHPKLIYEYLGRLPQALTCFLEVRHPQWMEQRIRNNLVNTLHNLKKGLVITDTPGRRDLVHMHLTVPKMLLRFVCHRDHPTTFSRTDEWVSRIHDWMERGLEEIYVFLHPGNDALVPGLAGYWVQALNAACGLQLKPPAIVQARLF